MPRKVLGKRNSSGIVVALQKRQGQGAEKRSRCSRLHRDAAVSFQDAAGGQLDDSQQAAARIGPRGYGKVTSEYEMVQKTAWHQKR